MLAASGSMAKRSEFNPYMIPLQTGISVRCVHPHSKYSWCTIRTSMLLLVVLVSANLPHRAITRTLLTVNPFRCKRDGTSPSDQGNNVHDTTAY